MISTLAPRVQMTRVSDRGQTGPVSGERAVRRRRRVVNTVTLGTPAGLLLARLGGASVHDGPHGLLLAAGYRARFPAPRAAAVTVGDVVLLRMPLETALARPRLLAHEAQHADQWARWCGPVVFLPAYGLASAWSWLRHRDAAVGNRFEVAAGLEDGGYGRRTAAAGGRTRLRAGSRRRARP